jgi:hypothetical protein
MKPRISARATARRLDTAQGFASQEKRAMPTSLEKAR